MSILEIKAWGIDHRQEQAVVLGLANLHARGLDRFRPFRRAPQERFHVGSLVGRRGWRDIRGVEEETEERRLACALCTHDLNRESGSVKTLRKQGKEEPFSSQQPKQNAKDSPVSNYMQVTARNLDPGEGVITIQ